MSPQIGAGHGGSDGPFAAPAEHPTPLAFPIDIRYEPEPAAQGIKRVCVGGPLHGRVLLVPVTARYVITYGQIDEALVEDNIVSQTWFALTGLVIMYAVRDQGKTRLLVETELIRSAERGGRTPGLGQSIVDALGLASGVHGVGGPLVVQMHAPDLGID